MDWVGNSYEGVNLSYKYLSSQEWSHYWEKIGLKPDHIIKNHGLYKFPLNIFFGINLHFIARIKK